MQVVVRDVRAHHLALVSGQRFDERPVRSGPEFERVIVGGGQDVVAGLLIEQRLGDHVRVRRDRVLELAFSQIPDFGRVIFAAGHDVVAVGREIHADDALQVALHEHDAATGPQTPDASERIETTADRQRAVRIEVQIVDRLRVALLKQNLLLETVLQVEQAPRFVKTTGGQKTAARMELQLRNAMRLVTFDCVQRLIVLQIPQVHGTLDRAGRQIDRFAFLRQRRLRMKRDRTDIARVTTKRLLHVHVVHRPQFAEARPGRGGDQLVVRTQLAARNWPTVAHLTADYLVVSKSLEKLLLGGGLKRFVGVRRFLFDAFDSRFRSGHRIVGYPNSGVSQLA